MAAKLIITRGLPASGKSTKAASYAAHPANEGKVRVVTMDDIRVAIGAQFEAGDEHIVQSVRDFTIREFLKKGYTVISADTNLNPKTFQRIDLIADGLGVETEVWDFTDVPLSTCLTRNFERRQAGDLKVPNTAIIEMHERYIKKS